MLEVAPDDVPRDWMWTRSAVILAELTAANGRGPACARWYDALAPYRARTAVAGGAVLFVGAVAHYLGLLAAATGRPELARRHLEDAAAVHERLGARPWLLRGRLELARLLGADPGGRERAAELVALSGGGRLARAGLGLGADAVLDDRAKRAYRRRLEELDLEVAEAEDGGDPDRLEKARGEREAIAHELAAALGLGGRDRGLGDPAERARKAVTERIRYSMARIARVHPELAGHLEASITTGSSCAYVAAEPVTWLT
jgi:hypothetical protein